MAQFFEFKEDYYGLSEPEVEQNAELYGLNIYTKKEKEKKKFSVPRVFLNPSFILMLLSALLCMVGGDIGAGIVILLIVIAYVFVEIYFGRESDKRLEDIRETTTVKFRMIRGGKLELLCKESIVPEDIIIVQAGERVPADAFVLEAKNLTVDESVFTGTNKPVAKYPGGVSKSEYSPSFVYSGTLVLTGKAICRVSATGVDTKLYQKYGDTTDTHGYYTSLEETVGSVIPLCSAVAAVMAFVSLLLWLFTDREIIPSALRGITLGLCFLPTGLRTIIRLYYTKGATDMLRENAIVKSLCDIEKLNCLSVLCVEKEGAISKNRLEVRDVHAVNEELFYKVATLACDRDTAVPAERALMVKASFFDENITDLYDENEFIEKIPESNEAMGGALWSIGGTKLYCIKGTPEQILPLCRLNSDALFAARKRYSDYYAAGCSVIAVACADAEQGDLESTAGFSYTFLGFAAFASPLRESVATAVKTCRRAGVRVVMLTEDNPSVAEATGKMIGLSDAKAVTGKMISDSVKYGSELPLDADIYAKITPEQKLYIIDQLKKSGEIVAMTGTRTTDADALDMADVGITFLQHTAGSTYESADIMMNDDNFSSIANMIASARQIHRNIKRASSAVISMYTSMILLNILNLFGDTQLMLNPPILAMLTMIVAPLVAICYICCRSDMKQSMPPSEYISNKKINLLFVGEACIVGLLIGGVAVASYMFMYNGSNVDFARSCALITYSMCTTLFGFLRLDINNPFSAAKSAGKPLLVGLAITFLLPILLVFVPVVNSCFGLVAIDILALFICIITGLLPGALYFAVKRFIRF